MQACQWRAGRPRPAAMLLRDLWWTGEDARRSTNEDSSLHTPVTFLILPLRNAAGFGIKIESRTSEHVSELPAESSR